MSMRIPPLLESLLALPPEASLVLLTSVLGASTNWLVLRHMYSYLRSPPSEEGADAGVVLVSFMRDGAFWREGASKLGLDLDRLSQNGRFVLVDGLTGLFTTEPGPARDRVLVSTKVDDVESEIEAALGSLRTGTKVLIVDQIDVLLAAASEDITSTALSAMLLSLREHVHSAVITLSADAPLVHAQTTTLEREHAALVLGQAHAAVRVMTLRMLDTGTARDVSGVLRVTGSLGDREGKEYLYYVGGDGGVKVFERGT